MLERVIEPMLRARDALRVEFNVLHRQVLAIVRTNAICRRLMTVPGVGAMVALTFTSAIDDPARFTSSKAVGAHFGLTPKPVRRDRRDRWHQPGRRRHDAYGALRGRTIHADAGGVLPSSMTWRMRDGSGSTTRALSVSV